VTGPAPLSSRYFLIVSAGATGMTLRN